MTAARTAIYVGFNNAWIVKLPAAPEGNFSRLSAPRSPRQDAAQPQQALAARGSSTGAFAWASPKPAFTGEQSYFLAETADVPLRGPAGCRRVGSAQWFWAEVHLHDQSFRELSDSQFSDQIRARSSAPIVAAAAEDSGSADVRAWNNNSIQGVPPRSTAGALQVALRNMSPALAIKLIPASDSEVSVGDFTLQNLGAKVVAQFSVAGQDIAEAWVETSRDQLDWVRASKLLRQQPYVFTLAADQLPAGSYVRGAARDSLGNLAYSEATAIPYATR